MKNIAVLTSAESWFYEYGKILVKLLDKIGYKSRLFENHENIGDEFDVVFILSYSKIIPRQYLNRHKHNIVVHGGALPHGRGWAPVFWQIIEGKNKIPMTLIEASEKVDRGDIYMRDYIKLKGTELNEEIRTKQAEKTIEMCLKFLQEYDTLTPVKQKGKASYYRRRNKEDSKLDPKKSILNQFNLLRTVNNEEFPAFFMHKGKKYILKIYNQNGDKNRQ